MVEEFDGSYWINGGYLIVNRCDYMWALSLGRGIIPAQARRRRRDSMKKYIGCALHKKYSVFVTMDEQGRTSAPVTVANDRLELGQFLKSVEENTPVAVEASGSWYWFVDRLEQAGLDVRLVNPLEARKRMAGRLGNDRVTTRNLTVAQIRAEQNLLLIVGAVAGSRGGYVEVRPASEEARA